ncbi:hypothetical protein [Streptomyces griseosporeus]|uniref:hypothetical protein n=1 Tax=Streptomyces griseosporeus TaxID=1910 RepID=UPI00167D030A|nr:hypothetical protein [Streptomyces griseosporeus]GHF37029.1 hypothetical protein GCM10018783_01720 [Streptomyces griseosporeus]
MSDTTEFGGLLRDLIALGNESGDGALEKAHHALSERFDIARLGHAYCAELPPARRDELLCMSTERSTHYKWCMASSGHRRARVWLHVYKPWTSATTNFAASIHDHRYSFVSAVLSGSLRERRWGHAEAGRIRPGRLFERPAGSTYRIESTEIHSIEKVCDGTVTLVLQMAATKVYSSVYDPHTLRIKQRIGDLEEAFGRMVDRVREGVSRPEL